MELKTFTATKKINGTDRHVELVPTRYLADELDGAEAKDQGLTLCIQVQSADEAVLMLGAIADEFIVAGNVAAQVPAAQKAKAEARASTKATKKDEPKAEAKDEEPKKEAKKSTKKAAAKKEAKPKNGAAKKSTKTKTKKTSVKSEEPIEVVDKTEEVDDDGFPVDEVTEPGEAAKPKAAQKSNGSVPDEVKAQGTARGLLTLLSTEFESREDLVAHCVSIQNDVPLLARMGSNVENRIERALDILKLYPEDNA